MARFRKEKTPEDVLKKLRGLKQKQLGVEDYSQKFRNLYNRLQAAQRPTPEQLGDYFCKGLRKELRGSVAGTDIQNQADFTDMVNTALRAERRVGKSKKKHKEDDSDSEEEEDGSDSDEDDSDSDSDNSDFEYSDDEEWIEKKKKKKKDKKKNKKKE